jgi:paraquat-inducible protein B
MSDAEAEISQRTQISAVWILPIVALLLGVWAVIYSVQSEGPRVEVRFETAQGLVEGKTEVRFLDVNVGFVEDIRFGNNHGEIVVALRLDPDVEDLLREDTRFWLVTARLGTTSISGLDTLLSGAYITMAPGESPNPADSFVALPEPPLTPPGAPGMHIKLLSSEAPSLGRGDAVLFQGYKVGRVEDLEFDSELKKIRYTLFVDAPHHKLIDSSVRFWDVSGITISAGADGFEISTGSLNTILLGGVAFGTPPGIGVGRDVLSGSEFKLYKNYKSILQNPYQYGVYYVVQFEQSLRGLHPGAPVEYRGIKLGFVERVMVTELLSQAQSYKGNPVPVLLYLEPGRVAGKDSQVWADNLEEIISKGVENGLRATLLSGSMLTGSLYVSIDYYPDEPAEVVGAFEGYSTIPTVVGGFSRLEAQLSAIVEKVNKLPLEDTVKGANLAIAELTTTISALREVIENDKTQSLTAELHQTLTEVRHTLSGVSPDSPAYQALNASLIELNSTLQNLNALTRTLADKPNAVVMPVDLPPDPTPEAQP